MAVGFDDIRAASRRIRGVVRATPVMRSSALDAFTGGTVFLKCESFQRTGSFKFRGALHALSRLPEADRARGVLTYSSGNHAQAMGRAGQLLKIPVTAIMPGDAPEVKIRATQATGVEIIRYERVMTSREALAARIADERGLTIIPPYDHPMVVAGQGTVTLDLLEEVGNLDLLVVPCGGGGLLSGAALVAKALSRDCRVIGVEPENADDATRSFQTGELQSVRDPDTIADGARTPSLGKITFPIVREYVDDMVTVSDAAIAAAMRVLYARQKLVVEPTGALAVAAVLARAIPDVLKKKHIGIIITGGNVDLDLLPDYWAMADPQILAQVL